MPRGGKRLGAGRPAGTSVLDPFETLCVAAECQKRWNADIEQRLGAEKERLLSLSGYNELAARNREGMRDQGQKWFRTYEGQDLKDDIEGSIREMAGMDPATTKRPPRVFRIEVPRPYRLKEAVLEEVAAWASARFGKKVTPGLVDAAWDVLKRVEKEPV